jgi:hypothetical protein
MGEPNAFRLNWYGERGIVNALVTHIATLSDPLAGLSRLLGAVEWANGSADWTKELREASVYVEVGLADFGNPDLIIVCTSADKVRRLVFVEAKAGPYIFSARSNTVGMREPGFNSAINGQLSLKYRFARALEAAAPHPEEGGYAAIAESPAMLAQYQARLNDPRSIPRRLFKPEIITNLLMHNALLGHPERQCCYVAFTWDTQDRAFFRDQQVGEDALPILLDDEGNSVFEGMKDRIGWLGYRACVEALRLEGDATFQGALQTMLSRLEPLPADYVVGQTTADISPEAIAAVEQIVQLVFAGRKVLRYPGSVSITDQGQTVAKILPRKNSVFVGVRETLDPASWFGGDLKDITIQGVRFWGIEMPLDIADPAPLHQLTTGMVWRE